METITSNSINCITGLIIIAIFIGGVIVAMSKAKFVTKEDCDEKCKGELVEKETCDEKHEILQSIVCVKIDIVQKDVDVIKIDIEKMEKSFTKFTFFMGQVSQYMKDQKV
jgi:hypothetical protein